MAPAEEKGLPVAEGVTDDVVPGERVDVVGRQVHDGRCLAQCGEGRVRVDEDVVGEEVDVRDREFT
jgi:hypothetical protein